MPEDGEDLIETKTEASQQRRDLELDATTSEMAAERTTHGAKPVDVRNRAKAVEARDVSLYYGDFRAVEGVDLTIQPNRVTALIGSSGCGKTTFLRSINRMHEITSGARTEGSITLDGHDVYGPGVDPVEVRRQIGMVFQQPNPFPTMSIYDNVAAGLRLNGKRIKRPEMDE